MNIDICIFRPRGVRNYDGVGGARLGSGKPVCAGLYDFVMSHYADDVRCMRCSCGCTVSADMEKGDNVV